MKILVSGGGTGGHIYPAVSLIKHIRKIDPTAEFLYVGTEKGLEQKIVPRENIPFTTLEIQGFKRSLSLTNFKTIYLFLKSVKQSKKMIKEFRPDVVIGTGGYVSGAVVYAASRLKVPTIIHEQNSVAGMTNKFLSRFVDKIGICFEDAAQDFPASKVELIGNPRAQEVAGLQKSDALTKYGLQNDIPTVLIFGGSRGALRINEAMLEGLIDFNQRDYQVLYASGNIYYEDVEKYLAEHQLENLKVKIVPYIEDMEQVLVNVDLVVGRAGATSLAEITGLGLPSVLIPSPNVTNDHQTKNAQSLVNQSAALVIKDSELTGKTLVNAVDQVMLDEDMRTKMSLQSKAQGIPDATDRLYRLVQELTN